MLNGDQSKAFVACKCCRAVGEGLVLASNNQNKIRELRQILGAALGPIRSLRDAGLEVHTIEDADTFEGNALKKAIEAMLASGCAALADDSGLEVDALGGAPGVFSARYAGEGATDAENNQKLIQNLRPLPPPYSARFTCAIALCRPGEAPLIVRESCEGTIRLEPAGENGFGYDPYFVPAGYDETFAQLPADVKNTISHRAKALKTLAERVIPRE